MDALQTKRDECDAVLVAVTNTLIPFKNAVNAREEGYEDMDSKATRIFNALAASGASEEVLKDARGIVNKISGRRTSKVDPDNPDAKTISTSQMSYDNRKANFELLVALVKTQTEYNPNEDDLKVISLEAYTARLGALNTDINTSLAAIQAKRTERDEVMYGPLEGMSDIATKVKYYVKSVVGASSPIYKRIAAIRIRKY